jgi:1-acyl-sn-glycerol-3-phosphate acyltransferase
LASRHYSDIGNGNVIHMHTPFALDINEKYDYRRRGLLPTVWFYIFHSFVIIILYPVFLLLFGFRIKGLRNMRGARRGGFVAVSNHVHVLDSPMFSCAVGFRRTYYVTLASNFCIPVVRHIIRWLGAVPLSDSPSQLGRMFGEMEAALRSGKALLMYPEGVLIPYCRKLRDFKRGTFLLAAKAEVPVVPMAITFRQPSGLYRLFKKKPLVTLNVMAPVYPDAALPVRARAAALESACRSAMLACVTGASGEAEKSTPTGGDAHESSFHAQ